MDPIRIALQEVLDKEAGEGWSVAHYAIMVGIERLSNDGNAECGTFIHTPVEQADYMTAGLLMDGAKRVMTVGPE